MSETIQVALEQQVDQRPQKTAFPKAPPSHLIGDNAFCRFPRQGIEDVALLQGVVGQLSSHHVQLGPIACCHLIRH